MLTLIRSDTPALAASPDVVFHAQVSERWIVTTRMHPRRFRELVPAPFLEPVIIRGSLVVSVCCVHMQRAAPAGLPVDCGVAGLVCAVRVACRDRRGAVCSWIARRHTDAALAAVMGAAGLPQVDGGLTGRSGPDRLELRADDGLLVCRVAPGHGPAPALFASLEDAVAVLTTSGRSYSTASGGHWIAVDLLRQDQGDCIACVGWEGWLRTPWGDCTIDGVYRTSGGIFRWSVAEEAGGDG